MLEFFKNADEISSALGRSHNHKFTVARVPFAYLVELLAPKHKSHDWLMLTQVCLIILFFWLVFLAIVGKAGL